MKKTIPERVKYLEGMFSTGSLTGEAYRRKYVRPSWESPHEGGDILEWTHNWKLL
jgi:hypothetical protein